MARTDIERRAAEPKAEVYAPNPIFRWLYRRFFGHIQIDERFPGVVRSAAERGVVVYVMRTISFLDFVCLDFLTKKLGLPLVRFVNDLGLSVLEPFGKGERRLRLRRQIPEQEAIASVVREGQSALLFLRRRPPIGQATTRKGPELEADLIRTLVETQKTQARPILLVPQTFVWSMLPPTTTRGPLDLIFGPVEWPGRIRRFLQFLFNYRNALLRAGEPFDLKAFIESSPPELSNEELADKVRYALVRRIERERALVLGPTKKTVGRLEEELLRSPRVRKHIEAEARSTGKSVAKVERQALDMLNRLAARQHPFVLRFLERFLDWVWNRIYDGMEVDKEGLERVRAAARDGAVIYLPSHKSHVDYLVLSFVLYVNALVPPLIAAGENLGFFPLGPILRRGGAFFIRRSFRGQKLYSALVDAYMRKLLVEGYGIEFFIEGGRSRTGKLLPPKYGLLSMVVDAALTLKTRKVYFAPISIGYERIIEERSYVHELSGGEKQRENVGGLLKTSSVLRSKYGRLYVQFGDVISFEDLVQEVLAESGTSPGPATMSPRARRVLVQRLAHQVTYRINEVTVVTPAALVASALLVHPRKGMTRSELHVAAADLLSTLRRARARIASAIEGEDGTPRAATLDEATALFVDARLIVPHENVHGEPVYTIPEERRLALEYYKNTVIHFFVDRGLIAAAMLVGGRRIIKESTLRRRVQELSRAFKYEFMFRADAEFDRIFDDTLREMVEQGELARSGEHVHPAESPEARMLPVYVTMLGTYFEAYVLALRGAALLLDGPLHRKEWLRRTLAMGQRMYLTGEIMRRESLTQHKLETALKSLKDHRLVAFEPSDMLAKGPDVSNREDLKAYEQKLSAFLKE